MMWRSARLIAGKDLRLEWRSRVGMNQVLPFAAVVLVMFAFALNPDSDLLQKATPGLFWVSVLFLALTTVGRTFSIESSEGISDSIRLSGLEPSGFFLGKVISIGVQLLILEVLLGIGVTVLYRASPAEWPLLLSTVGVATVGIAAAGTLYGMVAVSLRVRETILPLLLLPVLTPVLIGSTRAFEAAINETPADGWPWIGLMAVFSFVYVAAGIFGFGALMEDS